MLLLMGLSKLLEKAPTGYELYVWALCLGHSPAGSVDEYLVCLDTGSETSLNALVFSLKFQFFNLIA